MHRIPYSGLFSGALYFVKSREEAPELIFMVLIFVNDSYNHTSLDYELLIDCQRFQGLSSPWRGFPSTLACVRGYQVCSGIWEASIGEQLSCDRENGNGTDPFAVTSCWPRPRYLLALVHVLGLVIINFRRGKFS